MSARLILRPDYGTDPNAPKVHLTGSGQRFTIAVRPCPDDVPSLLEFGDYIEARTRARALRWEHGWKISDEVDAATRRQAEAAEAERVEAKRRGAR